MYAVKFLKLYFKIILYTRYVLHFKRGMLQLQTTRTRLYTKYSNYKLFYKYFRDCSKY